MKLNPDCIRDILLTIETSTTFTKGFSYNSETIYPLLEKYTPEEVLYHIEQIEMSELIFDVMWFCGNSCYVEGFTPSGHEFLSVIKDENNFKKILVNMAKLSLPHLIDLAKEILPKYTP